MEETFVKQWLDSLKLRQYEQRFKKHGYITMNQCIEAKNNILEKVGILNEKDYEVLKANLDFLKKFHLKMTNADKEAKTLEIHRLENCIQKINSNSNSNQKNIDETKMNSKENIREPCLNDKSLYSNVLVTEKNPVKPYKNPPIVKPPVPSPRRTCLTNMISPFSEINNGSQIKPSLDNELDKEIDEKLNSKLTHNYDQIPHSFEPSILNHVYENCCALNPIIKPNLKIVDDQDVESHRATVEITSNKEAGLECFNEINPDSLTNSYEEINFILSDTEKFIKTTDKDMVKGTFIDRLETLSDTNAFDTSSNSNYFIANPQNSSVSYSNTTLSTDSSERLFDYYRKDNDKKNLNSIHIITNKPEINYKAKSYIENQSNSEKTFIESFNDKLNDINILRQTAPSYNDRKSFDIGYKNDKANPNSVDFKILKTYSEQNLIISRNLSLDAFFVPSNDASTLNSSISSNQSVNLSPSFECLSDSKNTFNNLKFLLIKKDKANKNSALDDELKTEINLMEFEESKELEHDCSISFFSNSKKDSLRTIIFPINKAENTDVDKICIEEKTDLELPVYENLNESILEKNKYLYHENTNNDSKPVNDKISKNIYSISNYRNKCIKSQSEVDDSYVKLDSIYSSENSTHLPNGFINAYTSDDYELQTDNYVLDYLSTDDDTECTEKINLCTERTAKNDVPLENNEVLRSFVYKRQSSKYINSKTLENTKCRSNDNIFKNSIPPLGELTRNVPHSSSCTHSNIHQPKPIEIVETSKILINENIVFPKLPKFRNARRLTNISPTFPPAAQANNTFNLLSTKNFMEGFLLKSDQSKKLSMKSYYTLDENALTPVSDQKKKDKELVEIKLKRIIGVLADSQHLPGSSFELFLKSPEQVLRYTCEQVQYRNIWTTQIARAISVVCQEDRECINSFTKAGNVFTYCHVENAWNLVWMHLHGKCLYIYSCNSRFEETDLRKVKSIIKSPDVGQLASIPILKLFLVENQCLKIQTETASDFESWYNAMEKARVVKCPSKLSDNFLNADNVPVLVEKCIKFINKYGLEVEGIYRKSGQQSKTTELFNRFIQDGHGTIIHDNDVIEVSSCLKKFFKQLDETLFTKKHYNEWVEAFYTNKKYKVEKYKNLFSSLADINFATAKMLICHLAKVVRFKNCNKMDAMNIACIFSPLLFSEDLTQSNYTKISQQMEILKDLLENYNKIFEINLEEEEAQQLRMQEAMQRMEQLNAESNNSINMIKDVKMNKLLLSVIFNDSTTGSSETYNFNVTEETTAEMLEEQLIKRIGTSVGEHYYFFEVICNGELERLVHYKEKMMDVVMKYQDWPKDFTLGATFVYKASNVLQNYPHLRDRNLSLDSTLKYAKKKTFKKFAFSFIKYNLSYRKNNKSSAIISSWYVEELGIYSGNQHKRPSPYQYCISFYEKKQSPNMNGFFGHCLSFDNQLEYNTWLSILLFAQHSDGYRTPKKPIQVNNNNLLGLL